MKAIALEGLEKTFADGTRAVRGVDLAVEAGELVVLLGPSGCGKTTTLRMIAGLEAPSRGRIRLGAADVTRLRPSQRDVGFVFQFYALYPHLTVRENVAFPLRCSGVPRAERARRVEELAERLGLAPLLEHRPRQLSLGDQQRVALARAMVRRPAVWLMDEPLGTLDASLRLLLCEFLRAQQLEHGVTTVYVTHDQEEAMRLADRIVVMSEGVVLQADRAERVYDEPADLFVARFVGSPGMNFVTGEIRAGRDGAGRLHPEPPPSLWGRRARGPAGEPPGFTLSGGSRGEPPPALPLPPAALALPPGRVTLGIRPEFVALDAASPLRGRVAVDEYQGASRCLHVDTTAGRLVARVGPDESHARGAEVGLRLEPAHLRLFATDSGRRLA
jgi:multiple sugar transport system ATP-binding protein